MSKTSTCRSCETEARELPSPCPEGCTHVCPRCGRHVVEHEWFDDAVRLS